MICKLCPRLCGVDRDKTAGRCGVRGFLPVVARAALHFGEEPCFGKRVGAVFFSGCALGCSFCQNRAITSFPVGKRVSVERLCEIFLELQAQGAQALDLVTGSHFAPAIARSLDLARERLKIPVIWNGSGYESEEILDLLRGRVQIHLADFKFASAETAARFCGAPDYPAVAQNAIERILRDTGPCEFDENGVLRRGVVVRHLVLPGCVGDSLRVLAQLDRLVPDKRTILLSLLRQYTPVGANKPPLDRRVTTLEYEKAVRAAQSFGFLGYTQDRSSASASEIPVFDGTGV